MFKLRGRSVEVPVAEVPALHCTHEGGFQLAVPETRKSPLKRSSAVNSKALIQEGMLVFAEYTLPVANTAALIWTQGDGSWLRSSNLRAGN